MTGLEHQTFTLLHSKASGMGLLRLRVAPVTNRDLQFRSLIKIGFENEGWLLNLSFSLSSLLLPRDSFIPASRATDISSYTFNPSQIDLNCISITNIIEITIKS
jgi:hypothetical protein